MTSRNYYGNYIKIFQGKLRSKPSILQKKNVILSNLFWNENPKIPEYGLPEKYLYEPNSAIMKSGGFDEVGTFYNLKKLHKHSHLYTNSELIPFSGRIFKIENSIAYHKNEMKNFLEGKQSNITTRNFPETVESIRKKWKIKEGGNQYCFFTTDENDNKIVLICTKI